MPYSAKPQSIIEIDARLSELEQEKNRLLALREQLHRPRQLHLTQTSICQNRKSPFSEVCFAGEKKATKQWDTSLRSTKIIRG